MRILLAGAFPSDGIKLITHRIKCIKGPPGGAPRGCEEGGEW